MKEIAQIRKLSLWIFLIPLIAINLCLLISQNPEFLENTIFNVDKIAIYTHNALALISYSFTFR